MQVRVEKHPDPDDVLRIEDRVRDETIDASGLAAEEELVVFARQDGELVGGCCGSTWGGTCELNSLWVDRRYRRRGVGGRLLAVAEAKLWLGAVTRSCCSPTGSRRRDSTSDADTASWAESTTTRWEHRRSGSRSPCGPDHLSPVLLLGVDDP